MKYICTGILALATAVCHAQGFPAKAVHVVVPYAAGGGPDLQARQFAPKFAAALGGTVVVENKVGAAGVLAAQYVAQQRPDGYTLLLGSNTHLIQKHLQPDLNFDPIADFVPVSNMGVHQPYWWCARTIRPGRLRSSPRRSRRVRDK